jgi:stage V sporulation protein S
MSAVPSLNRNLHIDRDTTDESIIRVTGGTEVQGTASAIASVFYEQNEVKVQAAGAGAVNQAVKAIAVARGYIATRGMDLIVRPGFINIEGRDGQTISAIVFRLTLD